MYLRDHLEKLSYFFEVAKVGSIKEASVALNLTQPTITKSIKILEEAIGKNLFLRHSRGVELTKEGYYLREYCRVLFNQLDNIEAKLNSIEDSTSGSLKIGTYDSIAIYFWPKFLKSFFKKFPNINIELTTDRSKNIQKKVENGELDLGLIIEPIERKNLVVSILAVDTFQLYVSAKLNLSEVSSIELPLIYMPDALADQNQNRLINLLDAFNSKNRQFKTSSLESAKELIINGIGVGLLPKMVAKDALFKRKIKMFKSNKNLKNEFGQHQIGLVYQNNSFNAGPLNTLIKEIKNENWK